MQAATQQQQQQQTAADSNPINPITLKLALENTQRRGSGGQLASSQTTQQQAAATSADSTPIRPINLELGAAGTQRRASDGLRADALEPEQHSQQQLATQGNFDESQEIAWMGTSQTDLRGSQEQDQGGSHDAAAKSEDGALPMIPEESGQTGTSLPANAGSDSSSEGGSQARLAASDPATDPQDAKPVWRGFGDATEKALVQSRPLVQLDTQQQEAGQNVHDGLHSHLDEPLLEAQQQQQQQVGQLPEQADADLSRPLLQDTQQQHGLLGQAQEVLSRPLVQDSQQQNQLGSLESDAVRLQVQPDLQQQQQQVEANFASIRQAAAGTDSGTNADDISSLHASAAGVEHQQQQRHLLQDRNSSPGSDPSQTHVRTDFDALQIVSPGHGYLTAECKQSPCNTDCCPPGSRAPSDVAASQAERQEPTAWTASHGRPRQVVMQRLLLATTHTATPSNTADRVQRMGARDAAEWVAEVTRPTHAAAVVEEGSRFSLWHGRSAPGDQVLVPQSLDVLDSMLATPSSLMPEQASLVRPGVPLDTPSRAIRCGILP